MQVPRELHPVAWWVWAAGLATAASATTNPWLLALVGAVTWLVVVSCRGTHLGPRVPALPVAGRRHGGGAGALPGAAGRGRRGARLAAPARGVAAGVDAPASGCRVRSAVEAVLAGLYDGMRLACILLAFGAANALANPKRLLRSLPPALYEIGTALVVAVSVAAAAGRERAAGPARAGAARAARRVPAAGARSGCVGSWCRSLEDAFERRWRWRPDGRPRLRPHRRGDRRGGAPRRADAGRAARDLRRASTASSTPPPRAGSGCRCCSRRALRGPRPGERRAAGGAHPLPARPVALPRSSSSPVRVLTRLGMLVVGRTSMAVADRGSPRRRARPGRAARSPWWRCSPVLVAAAPSDGREPSPPPRPPDRRARTARWRSPDDRAARRRFRLRRAQVLSDIDLSVEEGELCLVAGRTGSASRRSSAPSTGSCRTSPAAP